MVAITSCEPENVKTVLSLKFKDFELPGLRKRGFHPLFGKGIFTTDGAEWEHSRAMLRPNFTRSQVADLDMLEKHITNLIAAIPTDGSTIDLQNLFFDLTLDSATEFLFGESANTLTTQNTFSETFTYCTDTLGKFMRFGMTRVPLKRYSRGLESIHAFVDRYVYMVLDHHRAQKEGLITSENDAARYIFLHELVKQTQDPMKLRSEALNILLAGRDTTASLLSDLWNTLSKRPDIWAKLHAEVDELNGKKPTFEELKNMKYLKYCVNECASP